MHSFKDQTNEAQALKFYNLLPKKVRHTINRIRNQDKYKAALLMMKALRKDPDVISRGLTKARIQSIAADYFGLNHREFAKVLNRQTRYEEAPPGMSDTVKKFKKDGMDDEMAFSLAWSIYNKRNETINEEYLTEGKTSASTYFEQVIVACANSKNMKEVKAAPGYAGWLAEAKKDRKWKTDDKTLDNFRKQIQRIAKSGSQAGQSSEKTSDLWKTVTGKGSDTSKADVMLGKHQVSVKGPEARLMSGVKTESLATLYAAFETINVKDLGLDLETIINDFVSKVKTEGAEFNSRTLKKQDPKTLSATNKKAFKDLQKQMDVKKLAEAAFKKAFATGQGEFAQAFAWEAMSGEKKFVKAGVADAMLVWPYNLRSVVWHPNLSLNHKYVTGVAKQMKFSANVKSNRIEKTIGGVKTKTGYTISQTVSLAMKTAEEEFDDAKNESIDQRMNLENMLMEGKIDEAKLTDMLKGIWQRLKNAIATAWAKLTQMISNLLSDLTTAIKGGMNSLLWAFELEPVLSVNTKVKF
jgi:hypothetical protein